MNKKCDKCSADMQICDLISTEDGVIVKFKCPKCGEKEMVSRKFVSKIKPQNRLGSN